MNINLKKAGLAAAICAATVVGGVAAAVPASAEMASGSAPYVERVTASGNLAQSVLPAVAPGQVGDLVTEARFGVTQANAVGAHSFRITAPAGTTFDSAIVSTLFTDGWTGRWTGTLSSDGKTLDVTMGERFWGTVKLISKIKSDGDNTREGEVGGGTAEVTAAATNGIPVGTSTSLSYTAKLILAQSEIPALAPGDVGDLVAEAWFNVSQANAAGAHSFRITAPTGTTFDSAIVSTLFTDGWTGRWTGTLSDDGKTLDVTMAERFWGTTKLTAKIKSDSDNTREGLVGGGSIEVTSTGARGIPVGASHELSYTAIDRAAGPSLVEFTGATTDANPVFSGTGAPGATITITLEDGRVLGSAIVTPEGTWEVPSEFELADGEYTVTATQTGDGMTESSDSMTVTVVGAPIADPMIAGGAGMALLAGAGAVFAIRRRAAQA